MAVSIGAGQQCRGWPGRLSSKEEDNLKEPEDWTLLLSDDCVWRRINTITLTTELQGFEGLTPIVFSGWGWGIGGSPRGVWRTRWLGLLFTFFLSRPVLLKHRDLVYFSYLCPWWKQTKPTKLRGHLPYWSPAWHCFSELTLGIDNAHQSTWVLLSA